MISFQEQQQQFIKSSPSSSIVFFFVCFSSLVKFRYLSLFVLFYFIYFLFIYLFFFFFFFFFFARWVKSTSSLFFVNQHLVRSSRRKWNDPFVYQSFREFSFSRTESGLCIYYSPTLANSNLLHNSRWITFPTQSCLSLHFFCAIHLCD